MTIGRGTQSVENIIAFLQAAVSGRVDGYPQFRNHWFPDFSNTNIGSAMEYLRRGMTSSFWQSRSVPRHVLSKDNGQAYDEAFRYRLRVVWHRAIAGNNNPLAAASRLRTETRGFEGFVHGGTLTTLEPWCKKTDEALRWLEDNTHKLRLCGIADCKFPHFVATKTRKTYCSDNCQETAEVNRSKERVAAQGVREIKKRELTPEGRKRIVRAVNARWEKYRREKRRSKRD